LTFSTCFTRLQLSQNKGNKQQEKAHAGKKLKEKKKKSSRKRSKRNRNKRKKEKRKGERR
jgi:hypothetical protein